MARKPSVILTPAEKKAAINDAKAALKAAKAALSAAERERKALEKTHQQQIKASDRALAALRKDVTTAEAALLKLTPPKAVPSPVTADPA